MLRLAWGSSRMYFAVRVAVTLLVGLALGLGATWLAVDVFIPGAVNNGAWTTNLSIGSPESNPYTRAAVALHGLFALNPSETVYYVAMKDERGEVLNGACSYEIVGRDPPARWWSITAYGPDEYLIANPTNRYSIDRSNVWRGRDGRMAIAVGTAPQPSNWIPVTGGKFTLVMRLFNPDSVVTRSPDRAPLPRVERVGCS